MPYKLTVTAPEGQEVEIPGLGIFSTGTYDISDVEALTYEHINTAFTVDVNEDEGVIVPVVTTLEDAVVGMAGVELVSVSDKPATKASTKSRPVDSGTDKTGAPGSGGGDN
jgi:hypothetical protein